MDLKLNKNVVLVEEVSFNIFSCQECQGKQLRELINWLWTSRLWVQVSTEEVFLFHFFFYIWKSNNQNIKISVREVGQGWGSRGRSGIAIFIVWLLDFQNKTNKQTKQCCSQELNPLSVDSQSTQQTLWWLWKTISLCAWKKKKKEIK